MYKISITLLTALLLSFLAGCAPSSSGSNTVDQSCTGNDSVKYLVTLDDNWNSVNFPTNYPSNAHFSPPIGMTHNDQTSLWTTGEPASAPIEQMAETGNNTMLEVYIDGMDPSNLGERINGAASGTQATPGEPFSFSIDTSTPYVSIVSMVAPSSDWFVGINSQLLRENGAWIAQLTRNLAAYDAGTENENANPFTINNDTDQNGTISLVTTDASSSDIADGRHRDGEPYLASLRFSIDCRS